MRFDKKKNLFYISIVITLYIIFWLKVNKDELYACGYEPNNKADCVDTQLSPRMIQDIMTRSDVYVVGNTSSTRIPHLIHHMWNTVYVPKSMADWIKSWPSKHPSWDYVFWTHEDIRELVNLTMPEYLSLFNSYPGNIYRSDIARYFILYSFGGLYLDLDIQCLRSVEDVVKEHACFLSQEPPVHASINFKMTTNFATGALMACRPHHPFFKVIIWQLPYNTRQGLLQATGPLLVNQVAQKFLMTLNDSSHPDHLFLAPPDWFHPAADGDFRKACEKVLHKFSRKTDDIKDDLTTKQLLDCQGLADRNFSNDPVESSYSNHHWVHTYLNKKSYGDKPGSDTIHIKDLVPTVKMASHMLAVLTD